MKTIKNTFNPFVLLLTALTVLITSLAIVEAGKPSHLKRHLKSQKDAAAVPAGSTIAMSCAKCQTVLVRDADEKKSFLDWFKPDKKHACPGCKGEFKHVGPKGKSGGVIYVHTCSKCGDESMYCCSTDGKPTKGMEKKN